MSWAEAWAGAATNIIVEHDDGESSGSGASGDETADETTLREAAVNKGSMHVSYNAYISHLTLLLACLPAVTSAHQTQSGLEGSPTWSLSSPDLLACPLDLLAYPLEDSATWNPS